MPEKSERKFERVINYVEDEVGADVNRDLMKVAIGAQDTGELDVDIVGGATVGLALKNGDRINPLTDSVIQGVGTDTLRVTAPSALDVSAAEVDVDIATQSLGELVTDLSAALQQNANDALRVTSPSPLDVSASEVDVDLNSQTLSPLTITDDGDLSIAAWNAGTLPTEQQTPIKVEDSGGVTVDPDPSPEYPELEGQQDLIDAGDLVMGPVGVSKTEALLISANSTDGANWSATVVWKDGNGNTVQTEQPSDITLENVQDDYARLVRKGASVEVTFTDTSGGTANNINAYIDAHK